MTDWEWDIETNPERMLSPEHLAKISPRRLWLVGIANARQLPLVSNEFFPDWKGAISAGELVADDPDARPTIERYHRNWSPPPATGLTQWVVEGLLFGGLLPRRNLPVAEIIPRVSGRLKRLKAERRGGR